MPKQLSRPISRTSSRKGIAAMTGERGIKTVERRRSRSSKEVTRTMKSSRTGWFLTLIAVLTIGLLLVACGGAEVPAPVEEEAPAAEEPAPEAEAPAEEEAVAEKPAGKYNEAPMLAKLVEAGELPPVDERLPEEPGVGVPEIADYLEPEIGQYGGTLKLVSIEEGDWGHDGGQVTGDGSCCWWFNKPGVRHDNTDVRPNVFAGYEMSPDGKEFTIFMREGMKFSDGSPFTTEDVAFWWSDVLLNEQLSPVIPPEWRAGRGPTAPVGKLEVIDDYTFKFIFEEPYGGFPAVWTYFRHPKLRDSGYAKQYHADYTPLEELEPLIAEKGFEPGEWWNLYRYMTNRLNQAETGMPTYSPWILVTRTPTLFRFERNPYFFKVDAAGNQLPYIDYVEVPVVADIEAATVKITAGEVDLARRPVNAANLPLYKQYEKEKGYRTLVQPQHASLAEVFLNITNQDPAWQEVVPDARFRKALSMGIERARLIDAVYLGLAEKPQTYTAPEFDPDQANAILDEIGMDQRDSEGFRLTPSGQKFEIRFELAPFTGEEIPVGEMVSKMWEDNLDIRTSIKSFETGVWQAANAENENHAFTWWSHYPRHPWHEYNDYVGVAWQETYAPSWVQWWESDGEEGVEPPEAYKELRLLQEEMFRTPDLERQKEIWEAIKQNVSENMWWIPIVDKVKQPIIWSADLGNVPEEGVAMTNAMAAPQQVYFKSAERRSQ